MEAINNIWNELKFQDFAITISISTIVYFVLGKITEGRIGHEFDKKLEKYKFEMNRRERAVKVAEVFANKFSKSEYAKINQLLWELSLWLPAEQYKQMCDSLKNAETEGKSVDPRSILIQIRKELGTPGELTEDDILRYN